jgi:hypothetical protein
MIKYKVTNENVVTEFQNEQSAIDFSNEHGGTVSSFEEISPTTPTADAVGAYLEKVIFPFVRNLINSFAAENIALGITPSGKTGVLLGMFTRQYDIHSNGYPISLKDTFDTGSLYESRSVIQYLRDNPAEFSGLSPFITDARLLKMKNSIELVLGVTLST